MNKNLVLFAFATTAVLASAAVRADEVKRPPRPEGMSERDYESLCEEGGWVNRKGSGYGLVQIVNRQQAVPAAAYGKALQMIQRDANVDFVIVESPTNAQITVEVIDDAASKSKLVVYPDELKAVVNVHPLKADSPAAEKIAERLQKMVVRAFGYVGGITGGGEGTLMDVMSDLERIDKARRRLPGDYVMRCGPFLERAGVKPYQRMTYRRACRQGWAPKPSNAFEQAIWDKVHELPSNPIKIKYDPKRDK